MLLHDNYDGSGGYCSCCGKKLNPATTVWLELDQRIDFYHDYEFGVPESSSQGWFPFGPACAAKQRKAAVLAAKAAGIFLGRRTIGKVAQAAFFIEARKLRG